MMLRVDFRETSALSALSNEALLQVILEKQEAASVQETALAFHKRCAEAGESLVALRRLTERASARIPLPKGIFISTEDRSAAYARLCLLLVQIEPQWQSAKQCLGALWVSEEELLTVRRLQAYLEACVEEAENRDGMDRESLRLIRQRLSVCEGQAEDLGSRLQGARHSMQELCLSVEGDFLIRLSKIADLEHEGRACDPFGASRLCGELIAAIARVECVLQKEKE